MPAVRRASITGHSNRTAAACCTKSTITTRAVRNSAGLLRACGGNDLMARAEKLKFPPKPYLSATPGFAGGADTPRDFLERCLADLAALEPKIGAFVNLNLAGARSAADRATARWREGRPLSKIDGMPVGIKDIIETADMPTENGSPLFAGFRSERDAASVAALREAGAVVVGKTVTTEFAATEPRGTRNPHDLRRTPGGSRSGSAAAGRPRGAPGGGRPPGVGA